MTFSELAASRREWIATVLEPWCKSAARSDLVLAELDWEDLAGRIDPQATLWFWAWSRFPRLVHEGIAGVNETARVRVRMRDGEIHEGFPDNRRTAHGRLVLLASNGESEPLSIDDIVAVEELANEDSP